jgi:uncharacterized protein (DUF697 family)
MSLLRRFWKRAWRTATSPRISEDELQRRLEGVKDLLPIPVFWLLGKAQSGKTSVIRALTGSSRAEIGNGFRPCTRTARIYPFPGEEDCILRFLDTRGLGEADYDPGEDMHQFERQAHLLLVVIKAMDQAQQSVLAALKQIKKNHPGWPVIVLQTVLHEGYAEPGMPHAIPYPYGEAPLPPAVPMELARSLAAQREWFTGYDCQFVPIDFTLPEDGLTPEHYGLSELWSAIEEALPLGLRTMFRKTREARRPLTDKYLRTARRHVWAYSAAAGGAGAVPVPVVDLPVVLAIQAKLFHAVASIYGQPMSVGRMVELSSSLGISYAARLGVRSLAKLIPVPGLGAGVSALFAAASTYALGEALCVYFSRFRDGDVPDVEVFRKAFAENLKIGQTWLRSYAAETSNPQRRVRDHEIPQSNERK